MREAFEAAGVLPAATLPDSAVAPQTVKTARIATMAYASAATRDLTGEAIAWEPRILSTVTVEQSAMDAIGLGGVVALSAAELEVADADGWAADLARYGLADGRDAVLRAVPVLRAQPSDFGTHWLDAPVAWRGIVRGVALRDGQRARIALADMTERLNVPLQPTLYTGAGGAEGGDDLKGKPKPVALGRCFNVPAVFLGNIDLGVGAGSLPTYQVHWRAVEAIDAVRIRGVAQTLVGGTPTTGQARAFASQGLFQIGASPDGEVRADVRGDNAGSYASSTAAVVERLLLSLGPTFAAEEIDAPTLALADLDLPGEIGLWQGPDPVLAVQAVQRILAGSGAVLGGGRAGQLRLFDPLSSGTPQFSLPAEWVLACEPVDMPATLRPVPTEVRVSWGPNYGPHTGMAGSVAAADRQRLENPVAPTARVVTTDTLVRVAQQRPLLLPGLYWAQNDAAARASRWADWLDAGPRAVRVVTDRYLGQIELGHIGAVTYPAYGLGAGFTGVVMAWREAVDGRRVEITLLGAAG